MDKINNYKKQTTKSWTIPWKYILNVKNYKFCQSNYISNEIKKKKLPEYPYIPISAIFLNER